MRFARIQNPPRHVSCARGDFPTGCLSGQYYIVYSINTQHVTRTRELAISFCGAVGTEKAKSPRTSSRSVYMPNIIYNL